jgi:hypothetical protein
LIGSIYQGYGEELDVLESQLNKNSITGVLQNPYNFTVDAIQVRAAEFYDKEDGHLVGLRDFGWVSKDELKPGEKSTSKVWEHAGETEEFPNTDFIVKADALKVDDADYNAGKVPTIEDLENYTRSLKALENAALEAAQQDVIKGIANYTVTYENGTKEIVNKSGTYRIPGDDKPS